MATPTTKAASMPVVDLPGKIIVLLLLPGKFSRENCYFQHNSTDVR